MGQTDSSYVGQEVKVCDVVLEIISLAENNNIALPFAFVYGAWRPKADYSRGVRREAPPPRHCQGSGAAPQLIMPILVSHVLLDAPFQIHIVK